jgi:plasmid stabilization system protein ParE
MVRKVTWNNSALRQLKKACKYIMQHSFQNALKVNSDIFKVTDSLAFHPEKYTLDKYKRNNDGSYRTFTLHRYRVSYRVYDTEVIVLRLRHTSMEPLEY